MTSNTITDMGVLKAELEQVSRQGYAVSLGERAEGAIGVSAPILEPGGRALAALSILGPAERVNDRLGECKELVKAAAATISRGLEESMQV